MLSRERVFSMKIYCSRYLRIRNFLFGSASHRGFKVFLGSLVFLPSLSLFLFLEKKKKSTNDFVSFVKIIVTSFNIISLERIGDDESLIGRDHYYRICVYVVDGTYVDVHRFIFDLLSPFVLLIYVVYLLGYAIRRARNVRDN